MSTAEILDELAKMSPAERREIARRLAEMEGHPAYHADPHRPAARIPVASAPGFLTG